MTLTPSVHHTHAASLFLMSACVQCGTVPLRWHSSDMLPDSGVAGWLMQGANWVSISLIHYSGKFIIDISFRPILRENCLFTLSPLQLHARHNSRFNQYIPGTTLMYSFFHLLSIFDLRSMWPSHDWKLPSTKVGCFSCSGDWTGWRAGGSSTKSASRRSWLAMKFKLKFSLSQ